MDRPSEGEGQEDGPAGDRAPEQRRSAWPRAKLGAMSSGATALPVRSAGPGQVVPGSDFAGGALPLTAEVDQGEPDKERAA